MSKGYPHLRRCIWFSQPILLFAFVGCQQSTLLKIQHSWEKTLCLLIWNISLFVVFYSLLHSERNAAKIFLEIKQWKNQAKSTWKDWSHEEDPMQWFYFLRTTLIGAWRLICNFLSSVQPETALNTEPPPLCPSCFSSWLLVLSRLVLPAHSSTLGCSSDPFHAGSNFDFHN